MSAYMEKCFQYVDYLHKPVWHEPPVHELLYNFLPDSCFTEGQT